MQDISRGGNEEGEFLRFWEGPSSADHISTKEKMGRPRFLALLLISALVFLSFSQGYGRRIRVMRHYGRWRSFEPVVYEKTTGIEREVVEMEMDYKDPGANTNPRIGPLFNSPASPPAI